MGSTGATVRERECSEWCNQRAAHCVASHIYLPVTDVALSLDLFPVVLSTVTALAGRDRSM